MIPQVLPVSRPAAYRVSDISVGSAFSVAWTLFELAKHPEIQSKLREELQVHGERSPYLQKVIREAMRLWPVGAQG